MESSLTISQQSTLSTTKVFKLTTRSSFQLVTSKTPQLRTSTSVWATHTFSSCAAGCLQQGVQQVHSAEMITLDSSCVKESKQNNARATLIRHMWRMTRENTSPYSLDTKSNRRRGKLDRRSSCWRGREDELIRSLWHRWMTFRGRAL